MKKTQNIGTIQIEINLSTDAEWVPAKPILKEYGYKNGTMLLQTCVSEGNQARDESGRIFLNKAGVAQLRKHAEKNNRQRVAAEEATAPQAVAKAASDVIPSTAQNLATICEMNETIADLQKELINLRKERAQLYESKKQAELYCSNWQSRYESAVFEKENAEKKMKTIKERSDWFCNAYHEIQDQNTSLLTSLNQLQHDHTASLSVLNRMNESANTASTEMSALQDRLNAATAKLDVVTKRNAELEAEVNTAKAVNEENEAKIAELTANIETLVGEFSKKWPILKTIARAIAKEIPDDDAGVTGLRDVSVGQKADIA